MRLLLLCAVSGSLYGQAIGKGSDIQLELNSYLDLSKDQTAKMIAGQEGFRSWREQKGNRAIQVQAEISEEKARTPLDANALGVRYVEIEVIRREIVDRQATLAADHQALLTVAQQPRYRTLEDAATLQPAIDEARSAWLLQPECGSRLISGDFAGGAPIFVLRFVGNCGLSDPSSIPRSWPLLQRFLELSDVQVTTIIANLSEFALWRQTKNRRVSQLETEIARETAADAVDPGALGTRYVEIETIRREVADRQSKLVPNNQLLLTAAQKPKFMALDQAVKLQFVIYEARAISLMTDPCAAAVVGLRDGSNCSYNAIRAPFYFLPPQQP